MPFWLSPLAKPARDRALPLAGIALMTTVAMMHSQLSSVMVSRGDDMLYEGNARRALIFYRRALLLDASNAVAIDRYVFVSMTLHERSALLSAIHAATDYLARHPEGTAVRMDRGLCEWRLRLAASAESDFAAVARARADKRAFVFAGYAALAAGSRRRARRWWYDALSIDASYAPALRALSHA